MKKVLFILAVLPFSLFAQSPKRIIKKLKNDPVFFIDSINVDRSELNNYEATDIASVSVYKDSNAIKLIGDEGRDGVVYIETKAFAKAKYWNYFKSKSSRYAELVPSPQADTVVQYILNKRVLKSNFEGDLSLIDDKIFKEIIVIDKATLEKEYGMTNKSIGVIIKSDKPDDLYKGNKKF
jgi:hypothetical protein